MTSKARWSAEFARTACVVETSLGTRWDVDVDAELGGQHPSPHELVDAALAACTTLTLELYAKRKRLALSSVRVDVEHRKLADGSVLQRTVTLEGALSATDIESLMRVAQMCPIHQMLTSKIEIDTRLAGEAG
jgi:putative redox protein